MHVIFMPYGHKQSVDHLMMDMQAQKFKLPLSFTFGKEKKEIWIQGNLRLCPFGIWEYCFPKEYKDIVLTTLNFHQHNNKDRYNIGKYLFLIRKILRAEKIKDFDKKDKLLWIKDNVEIIPIGIREDADMIESSGEYTGWKHEAI